MSLVGSSFSGEWTGFADALRHALQQDVVNFSVNADVGQWNVMRSYLGDDAFQVKPPALVIWEFPERTIAWPPSYKFREPRYQVDDSEWLLQVAALAQPRCQPAGINAKTESTGLLSGAPTGTATRETDFIEVSFDKPIDRRSYFSARMTVFGSRQISIETYRRGARIRKVALEVAGDEEDHALKTPLDSTDQGVQRIRLFPGNTHAFKIADIEVCRYAD